MIRVQPASARRREFARWAVARRLRTVESTTFGVPEELFPVIPEALLAGALVDGQRYVPVSAAAAPLPPAPQSPQSLPEPLPSPVPALPVKPAAEPVTEPFTEPVTDLPYDGPPTDDDAPGEESPADDDLVCDCGHTANTPHGLKIHKGRAHKQESP